MLVLVRAHPLRSTKAKGLTEQLCAAPRVSALTPPRLHHVFKLYQTDPGHPPFAGVGAQKQPTNFKDIQKEMEVFQKTGEHPELEAQQQAASSVVPALPDVDVHRPHVFMDLQHSKHMLGAQTAGLLVFGPSLLLALGEPRQTGCCHLSCLFCHPCCLSTLCTAHCLLAGSRSSRSLRSCSQ